jgi:hypothetical protein
VRRKRTAPVRMPSKVPIGTRASTGLFEFMKVFFGDARGGCGCRRFGEIGSCPDGRETICLLRRTGSLAAALRPGGTVQQPFLSCPDSCWLDCSSRRSWWHGRRREEGTSDGRGAQRWTRDRCISGPHAVRVPSMVRIEPYTGTGLVANMAVAVPPLPGRNAAIGDGDRRMSFW